MSSVCSAATPLMLCEPTVARCAMRTCLCLPSPSSMIDMRPMRSMSPGQRVCTCAHEAVVDLVDDHQVARQQALEQRHRPALQRLRHQRVVGVPERALAQVPGVVPVEPLVVEEDAHQLGDGDRRVRVVELDRDLVGERVERRVAALVAPHDVGDRAGDEEVLLLEAQRLALLALIVGVEHLGDVLGVDLLLDGAAVVALVEELQVEVARRARRPQAQRVHRVGAVADDERVVRQPDHRARVDPVGDAGARCRRGASRRGRRSAPSARPRGAAAPRGCRAGASCRGARPGGRPRCSARTCRSRSGCRSRPRAAPASPASP